MEREPTRRGPTRRHLSLEDQVADRLIRRFQRGDARAFVLLYEQFGQAVRTYLTARLGCAQDAQDVSQIVFLRAFQALPRYRIEARPFRHWLFTVARNAAEDHRRRLERSDRTPDEWLERLVESRPVLPEWGGVAELARHLDELSLLQRQVLTLLYRWQMTAKEAGEVLGRPEATIRKIHSRALRTLRHQLTPA
jgi:RNA polymerase sigma-70 factor (ECF subfamily)